MQGSIFSSELWIVSYDDILLYYSLNLPDATYLVGYVDDIVAIVITRDAEDARRKLNQVMIRTQLWQERGLKSEDRHRRRGSS